MQEKYPGWEYQPLFDHMSIQYDLELTKGEMDDILAEAAKVEAAPKSRWISVEERLPECEPGKWSKDVIALTLEGNVYRLAIQDTYWQRTNSFVNDGNTIVTHWMPLDHPDGGITF